MYLLSRQIGTGTYDPDNLFPINWVEYFEKKLLVTIASYWVSEQVQLVDFLCLILLVQRLHHIKIVTFPFSLGSYQPQWALAKVLNLLMMFVFVVQQKCLVGSCSHNVQLSFVVERGFYVKHWICEGLMVFITVFV